MPKIDYKAVKAISPRLVLSHYGVQLTEKVVSGELKLVGRCPIHTDGEQLRRNHFQFCLDSPRRPATNGHFMCFSCGARGTIVDFVVLMEKLVDPAAVDWHKVAESRKAAQGSASSRRTSAKWNWCDEESLKLASTLLHRWFLAKNGNGQAPKIEQERRNGASPSLPSSNRTWREQWPRDATYPQFYVQNEYLASRGIRQDVLDEFGVGFYYRDPPKSKLNGRIFFPIHNLKGELLAFATRAPGDADDGQRYWFPDGFHKGLELWNVHRALEEKDVIVVEGFFAAMAIYQASYHCVVATMGSSLTETQADTIAEHFASAVIVADPDDAGRKMAKQAVDLLAGRISVKLVFPKVQPDEMSESELKVLLG